MTDSFMPPCASAAHGYVDLGLAVIPVVPGDKRPATNHGLSDWTNNPAQVDFWWGVGEEPGTPGTNPSYNVGIVCGQCSGGLLVIDLDVHGESSGLATLSDWETAHGRLPETWAQITGSGGKQLFYRVDRTMRPSVNGALGVDIRCDGSYVVAPPSIHPCGEPYEWGISPDDMDIADANSLVYEFIDFVHPRADERKELFELPEAIERDRNDTLFRYACSCRSKGLSAEEISAVMHAANSTRCSPPLDEGELMKIVGSVCRYAPGNERHQDNGQAPTPSGEGEGLSSIYERPEEPSGRIKDETVDKILGILKSLEEPRESIKLNQFDSRLHVLGRCIPNVPFDAPHVLTAGESVNLRAVLERDYGVRSKQKFEDALLGFGALESQRYNPMHDLISSLPKVRYRDPSMAGAQCVPVDISYDGGETWEEAQSVLGTLTYELLAVEPTSYSVEVEKLMFRQLVARAMRPGCKADQMFVFVGRQGTGKSTFVRLLSLSSEFFLEGFSNFDTEDLKRISGKLVVEIPELDGFNGRDKNRIKSIITQTTDNYRESYAKVPVEHPRTAVFFGTTNDGAFLNDSTGGRRYMLVESPKPMNEADPRLFNGEGEGLIKQAWAETLAIYSMMGEEAFMKTLHLPADVAKEAADAVASSSLNLLTASDTLDYLDDLAAKGIDKVNVKQVLMDGFGYNEWQVGMVSKWTRNTITATIDGAPGWERVGRLRLGRFGTARTWATGESLAAFKASHL